MYRLREWKCKEEVNDDSDRSEYLCTSLSMTT
jgi:hypothetical protein